MSLFDNFLKEDTAISYRSKDLWRGKIQESENDKYRKAENYPTLNPVDKRLLIEELLEAELEYLSETDVCKYCRQTYKRSENLAQLRCKYHPCIGPMRTRPACCGADVRNEVAYHVGCVHCDHTPVQKGGKPDRNPRWTQDNRTYRVPVCLINLLKIDAENILSTHENTDTPMKSFSIVRRTAD